MVVVGNVDGEDESDGDSDGEVVSVGASVGDSDTDGAIETVGQSDTDGDSDGNIDTDGANETVGKSDTDGDPVGYELGERVLCRSQSRSTLGLSLVQLMEPLRSLFSTAYGTYEKKKCCRTNNKKLS